MTPKINLFGRTERIKNLQSCSDRPCFSKLDLWMNWCAFYSVTQITQTSIYLSCCLWRIEVNEKVYQYSYQQKCCKSEMYYYTLASRIHLFTPVFSEKCSSNGLGNLDSTINFLDKGLGFKYARKLSFYIVFGLIRCLGNRRVISSILFIFLYISLFFPIYKLLTTAEYISFGGRLIYD